MKKYSLKSKTESGKKVFFIANADGSNALFRKTFSNRESAKKKLDVMNRPNTLREFISISGYDKTAGKMPTFDQLKKAVEKHKCKPELKRDIYSYFKYK